MKPAEGKREIWNGTEAPTQGERETKRKLGKPEDSASSGIGLGWELLPLLRGSTGDIEARERGIETRACMCVARWSGARRCGDGLGFSLPRVVARAVLLVVVVVVVVVATAAEEASPTPAGGGGESDDCCAVYVRGPGAAAAG